MPPTARLVVVLMHLSAAAPVASLTGQAAPTAERPYRFSIFLGLAATNLAGGPSRGWTPQISPLGAAVERRVGRRLSARAEAFVQTAGADLGSLQVDFFDYEGSIDRAQAGVAGLVRVYSSPVAARGFFAGLGASVTAQTSCDVDLAGGPGFLGGETVACKDWTAMELRPASLTTAAVAAVGLARGRFDVEVRYDHGLQAAIETRSGDMRVRSLAAVLHFRLPHLG